MTTYTSVFGDQAIPPSSNSFVQVSLTADTQLSWPQLAIGENLVASTMDVASSGNYKLRMPSAVLVSTGQDLIINNRGSSSFTLSDYLGNEIAVIAPGVIKYAYLTDNSTEQGTWAVFTFGSGTSGADAISLAGKGLVVDENKLSQSTVVMASSNSSTITLSHRSSTVTYSNSGSVTCALLDAWVAGNGFFFNLSNQGTGQVTIDPYAFQLVDGSSNKALAPGESLTLVCTGSGWVSIGYGRSTQFQFTKLVLDITSGSPISLTSAQASNKLIEFIGTLAAPATVILPSVTAVYYTQCSYSGAFSVTLKTAAGSGVVLQPGELSIVYCDSVDVVMAQTANVPLTNLEGGTAGAIVYQSNEGATGFSAPGVVGDLLRSGGVGAPTWTEPNQFLTLKTSPTGSTLLPTGTSAQRDVTPYFGMFRGNTDSQALEYYSGTGWSGINGSAVMNEESFTATEGQTLITLAGRYTIGTDALSVYINGLEQGTGAYTETSTSSITFTEGLSTGDYVEIRWGTSEFLSETDASLVSYQPSGTGAVTTNVQAKLRESVSVKDFGAVGDGVTDDGAAEDSANAASEAFSFGHGEFSGVTDPLNLYRNTDDEYKSVLGEKLQSGTGSSPCTKANPIFWVQKHSGASRNTNPHEWDQVGYFGLIKEAGSAFGAALTGYGLAKTGGGDLIGIHGRAASQVSGSRTYGGWFYSVVETGITPETAHGIEINALNKGTDLGYGGLSQALRICMADSTADTNNFATAISIGKTTTGGSNGFWTGIRFEADSVKGDAGVLSDGEYIRLDVPRTTQNVGGLRFAKRISGDTGMFKYAIRTNEAAFANDNALLLGTNQRIRWGDAATGLCINGGSTTLSVLNGVINVANPVGGAALQVSGVQVLSTRATGWTASSGTATRSGFVTSSATTSQVAEALKALIDDLFQHGLIGA